MPTTQSVIDHHLQSFHARDLADLMSDYDAGAVLFTPSGPQRGRDAIEGLFRALLDEFGKPGATFRLHRLTVDGEHGYIVWSAQTADNVYELGTDTFVVRDGKIAVQSFAGRVVPRR
jgi:ketosteroid isomerase-like protein